MIIYTVYDASDGDEMAYCTKAAAIRFARECSAGTEVHRVDIGEPTKARLCDLYNREGYAKTVTVVFTTPKSIES